MPPVSAGIHCAKRLQFWSSCTDVCVDAELSARPYQVFQTYGKRGLPRVRNVKKVCTSMATDTKGRSDRRVFFPNLRHFFRATFHSSIFSCFFFQLLEC